VPRAGERWRRRPSGCTVQLVRWGPYLAALTAVAALLAGTSGAFAAAGRLPVAELQEALARVESRVVTLEREKAELRDRVAKAEGKIPNQTRTFLLGLLSGIAAVLLKWGIDARRERADRRRREAALVAACGAELDLAKQSAERNSDNVQRELEALREQRGESVSPLLRMQLPTLARLIEDPPRGLATDGALLTNVTMLLVEAQYANDLSRTRDAYKSMPVTDVVGLRVVGELLERHLKTVAGRIAAVAPGVAGLEPRG